MYSRLTYLSWFLDFSGFSKRVPNYRNFFDLDFIMNSMKFQYFEK